MNPVSNWLNELSFYVCSAQYCSECKYIGKYHTHGPKGQRKYQGSVFINNTAHLAFASPSTDLNITDVSLDSTAAITNFNFDTTTAATATTGDFSVLDGK